MSKKILIYGLAFGSASAALNYIYAATYIYKQGLSINLLMVSLEFLIIPFIGVFLFLKSFKSEQLEQFTFGKAVFMCFFVSVMIGATVSLASSYFANFDNSYLLAMINYKIDTAKAMALKLNKSAEELKNVIDNTNEAYSNSGIFRFQMVLATGRGLLFSAIISYLLKAKMVSNNDDGTNLRTK